MMNEFTSGQRPLVLIVEDEPIVRLVASDILGEAGFEVIEASTADEAARMLDARPDVAVLFTDVHMPGSIDGLALAKMAPDRWPSVKVVVTSGRARPEVGDLPDGTLFVPKPYRAEEVQSLLSGGSEP